VPPRINIAAACCTRWARATPSAVAERWEHEDGRAATLTYAHLQQQQADRLSRALHRLDVHGEPEAVFFMGCWRNEGVACARYTGDPAASWCRTGDMPVMDDEDALWYPGRSDDMFKSAGYRIGPSELENCLLGHSAVANAAVVPHRTPSAARSSRPVSCSRPGSPAMRCWWRRFGGRVRRTGRASTPEPDAAE
jgi:acyl-coenzyme A synthetase/AMP-(fatty) acid ligase